MSAPATSGPAIVTAGPRSPRKVPAAVKLGRPPAFLSQASLALELDVADEDIPDLVAKGILPKPSVMPGGMVRWEWDVVRLALSGLAGGSVVMSDPYLTGARNATATR